LRLRAFDVETHSFHREEFRLLLERRRALYDDGLMKGDDEAVVDKAIDHVSSLLAQWDGDKPRANTTSVAVAKVLRIHVLCKLCLCLCQT